MPGESLKPQFSLKSLMYAFVGVSVFCALFFELPNWLAVYIMVLMLVLAGPAVLGGIVYCSGHPRAFCIGCGLPMGILALSYLLNRSIPLMEIWDTGLNNSYTDREYDEIKVFLFLLFLLIVFSGLTTVSIRRLSLNQPRETNHASAESEQRDDHTSVKKDGDLSV